ncbi:MAG: hypothetical protein QM719_10005 [Thermomonas sp.]
MRFRSAALFALAFAIGSAGAQELQHEDKWVGTVVPPYPSGVHELSGSCVGPGTSGDEICTISIHVLRDEQSHVRTVLASHELRHPDGTLVGGDKPLQLVTDAIEPDVLYDAKIELAVGTCQRDGADDPRIVAALVPGPDVEWFAAFRGLWRLGDDGRFDDLAPAGVRCRNEGFGYDG